jgi:hypothetical protein
VKITRYKLDEWSMIKKYEAVLTDRILRHIRLYLSPIADHQEAVNSHCYCTTLRNLKQAKLTLVSSLLELEWAVYHWDKCLICSGDYVKKQRTCPLYLIPLDI